MKMPREFTACALWVAAALLMCFGTVDSIQESRNMPLLAWGIFLAVVACVPTGWCIVKRETENHDEVNVEQIVEVVDALHQGRKDVSRLH